MEWRQMTRLWGMSTEASLSSYRDRNSTADKALTILEMFAEDHLAVSAMEVSKTLGVARSTAYRYLESLVSRGFLEEAPSGGFRLGLKVLELSRVARIGYGLSEIALPRMRGLCARFGQTVLLTRRVGTTVMCLEREMVPGRLVRISYERGAQLPLTAGASALVLLAWLAEEEARELLESAARPSFTERTLTELGTLMERLRKIRADGYCVSEGEVDANALGIAAPVFGKEDDVAAGLSIVALGGSVDPQERREMIEAVRQAAAEISGVLALTEG